MIRRFFSRVCQGPGCEKILERARPLKIFCSSRCASRRNRDPKWREYRKAQARRHRDLRAHYAAQLKQKITAAADRVDSRTLREEFLAAYGSRCVCCGETERRFLTIGHLNHDGAAHRARVGYDGTQVLRDLKMRGWPKDEGIAIQCANCNMATARPGIVCPHEVARKREQGAGLPRRIRNSR